jgi:hypothetical protein
MELFNLKVVYEPWLRSRYYLIVFKKAGGKIINGEANIY